MKHQSTGSGHHHQQHTIIQMPPPVPPPMPPPKQLKPPILYLLRGSREVYISIGVPLYEAAIKGDWKAAKTILDKQTDLIRCAITENHDTLLHVAASAERTKAVEEFVKNLLMLMKETDLELQNKTWETALSSAAAVGNIETAKALVEKNAALIDMPNHEKFLPLNVAASYAKPEMVRYLYGISKQMRGDFWTSDNRGWVLQKCVEADIFDVAIKIIKDCPELTKNKKLLGDVLLALAEKTGAFEGKKPNVVFRIIKSFLAVLGVKVGPREKEREALNVFRILWEKIVKLPKRDINDIIRGPLVKVYDKDKVKESEVVPLLKKILEKIGTGAKMETKKESELRFSYPSRVLFVATKMGNTRFITELIRLYPDVIRKVDDKGKTIFHLAIKCRHAEIYNLLYEIGAMKDLVTPIKDKNGNNMLHMVAKSAKNINIENVFGAALHIQRELLWFKEVEKMIPPQFRKRKNEAGETPEDLFAKKYASLMTKCEGWMEKYMLVATLIATIVFAAAFTLPGGYNQNTGIPFFRKKTSLLIFVISDAISLISSSTSILIFVYILTSNFAGRGFLVWLPEKLIAGVLTLFLSIVTMMVAFSASFFVLYEEKLNWVPITVTCLAGMPIILFAILQFHQLIDTCLSVYESRSLFKPYRQISYN